MKNASQLISKLRMPSGDDGAPAKKPKDAPPEDPDYDSAFDPDAADAEGELGGSLADFSEEELKAELAKRSKLAAPKAPLEPEDELEPEAEDEEDEDAGY